MGACLGKVSVVRWSRHDGTCAIDSRYSIGQCRVTCSVPEGGGPARKGPCTYSYLHWQEAGHALEWAGCGVEPNANAIALALVLGQGFYCFAHSAQGESTCIWSSSGGDTVGGLLTQDADRLLAQLVLLSCPGANHSLI